MTRYRPIATAPKDGTPVLLCRDDPVFGWTRPIVGWWGVNEWMTDGNVHEEWTHWHEIPQQPASESTP